MGIPWMRLRVNQWELLIHLTHGEGNRRWMPFLKWTISMAFFSKQIFAWSPDCEFQKSLPRGQSESLCYSKGCFSDLHSRDAKIQPFSYLAFTRTERFWLLNQLRCVLEDQGKKNPLTFSAPLTQTARCPVLMPSRSSRYARVISSLSLSFVWTAIASLSLWFYSGNSFLFYRDWLGQTLSLFFTLPSRWEQDGYANGVYQRVVSWIGWF